MVCVFTVIFVVQAFPWGCRVVDLNSRECRKLKVGKTLESYLVSKEHTWYTATPQITGEVTPTSQSQNRVHTLVFT